ncbi:MAG: Cna B-type domain-containing protein [Clostridia bacterium]|nr:Cna B-type domain-containing protein [Clostridia bacterium]
MKQGKGMSNEMRKKRLKRKRQTSIITVFLWIFLIVTMVAITATSMKNKNALEVEDNNWNITLVMYDRSSNTPNDAVTDVTWNATSESDTKQLVVQTNYACTTGKAYQPGEIVIEIPGIAKDSFSEYWRNATKYEYWLKNNVVIAADKDTDTVKQYDWSYSYNETTNTYTFTNNIEIAENEHFEGTIQIAYNLLPRLRIQTDLEFQTKMKENINSDTIIAMNSNICNFHYTSTKKTYSLTKYATAGAKTDYTKIEDILDDYYWVRYYFRQSNSTGVINAYDEDNNVMQGTNHEYKCIKEELPEGCVLYDKNLNKIEPVEGNTYYYLSSDWLYFSSSSSSYYYYVGYPKSKYNEGDSITNTAELWGRYEDEEEMQKLAEASETVSLVKFNFEYTGELYSISKRNAESGIIVSYINRIKNGGEELLWRIGATAFYTDSLMDVEIGDDLLYITRENGEVTKLEDSEYNFTKITIPTFYTYNKYSGDRGDALIGYEYDLQVRYARTNEYISYKKGVTSDKSEIITLDNNIVGIKLIIKDLDKTLYSSLNRMSVYTNIHTQDCKVGQIYNFSYLQVYKKDEAGNRTLANEVTKDSYTTPSTLKIAEYDMNTYGKYIQRSYVSKSMKDGSFGLRVSKNYRNLVNNVKEEKYELDYCLYNELILQYYNVDKDCIIKTYDILPEGMILDSSEEEIKESISNNLPYENLKLKDGTIFNTRQELVDYIKNHTKVEIDYNYRESGRTKISMIYNLNGIDWSYYLVDQIGSWNVISNYISTYLKVEIPYGSITEYGTTYKNGVYSMWNNQEYTYDIYSYTIDNGKYDNLASDIDNDGITDEKLADDFDTLNITHAVSSQQAVIKQVRTDLTKGAFVEGTAEATAGSEYTYKLRVTTGANSLKDLILYDTLETIYDENGNDISSGWKGEFVGVDTTYAEGKGYAPVVYYSEEQNPGKLTEVPDKWKVLDESVDKTKVKSICVDLRYQADGSEMELPANNVVFVLVNMKAPDDDTIITSANNMFKTNWRAIDPLGTVIDNVEGIYSNQVNVEIHKEDVRMSIEGQKTWIDENNKYNARPESITVKLLQDGQEYATTTTDASKNWAYTFENVPVYASNTHAYEYEVVEEAVTGYQTTYDGYDITNEIELTELTASKVWEDNHNEAGKRPTSVILQVKDGDKLIAEHEVSEANGWKYTFTGLQKYRTDGTEIVYTVDEKSFANDMFYTKEIVGNVITNRFTVPEDKIKLTGTKVWNDNNNESGKRPESITLQVKVGDTVVSEAEVNNGNNWTYEFELAKYDRLGNEITYTIDEKDTGSKFYVKESVVGNVVTNKFEVPDEKVQIEVMKTWDDNDNEAGKRADSVILQVKEGERVVEEYTVTENDGWKHTFELPKYDRLGNEIVYTVDEEYVNEFYVKEIVGNTITNKFTVPEDKIKITGTKVWDDLEDFAKKRPESVILQLIGDGEVITEHEVNAGNNWSYEFEVPKYDRYGNEIEYHIDERDIGSKFYVKELTDSTTVTNKFEVPDEKVQIEVMKTWDDNDNEAGKRPASITLQVKNHGVVVAEQIVTEANDWKHTFELPKYNETGDEIEYTVDEELTSEFYVKNIVGNVITNQFVVPEDRIKFVGRKVWEDNGNAGGKRDSQIILQVKAGEEVVAEAEVSEENNWTYEFELAKYDRYGNEIEYHIDERETGNKFYEKELTDSSTVTNRFVVPDEVVIVKAVKKWEDKNDLYGKRPGSVTLQVLVGDKVVEEEKVNEKNNWSYEFKLPKYDESGDEIEYTVDEKNTPNNYEKKVEGYTVINTCTYEPPVDTDDMNIWMYLVIFLVAIVGVVVGILIVKKSKK